MGGNGLYCCVVCFRATDELIVCLRDAVNDVCGRRASRFIFALQNIHFSPVRHALKCKAPSDQNDGNYLRLRWHRVAACIGSVGAVEKMKKAPISCPATEGTGLHEKSESCMLDIGILDQICKECKDSFKFIVSVSVSSSKDSL